jgi:hypothetical protein
LNAQPEPEDAGPRASKASAEGMHGHTTRPEHAAGVRAPWRASAPSTSRDAAGRMAPALSPLRGRVLGHLIACGGTGATDEEAEQALGIKVQTYTPRRRELVMLGLVRDSGRRRCTDAGRSAVVWVAVRGGPGPHEP